MLPRQTAEGLESVNCETLTDSVFSLFSVLKGSVIPDTVSQVMTNQLKVRSSLLELVLPLDTELTDSDFPRLAEVLQGQLVPCDKWLAETGHLTHLNRDVLEQIFLVSLDFYNSGLKQRDSCVSGHLLVFSLFLQKISVRGKRILGQRKKLTEDEILTNFLSENLKVLKVIFAEKYLTEILHLVFEDSEDIPDIDELLRGTYEIVPDMNGVKSCIKHGKRLSWELANKMTMSKAKMGTTARVGGGGRKQIILSQLSRQTLVKDSQTLRGGCLLVHRSRQSQLFLPTRLESLQLSSSNELLVVVGAVSRTVKISGCRNSTVIVAARRLVVQECLNCTFYLFTPNKPLLGLSCHSLTFAPLNINYEGLAEDMREAGLEPQAENFWDSPLLLSNAHVERPIYRLLPVKDFDLGMFPVSSALMTSLVPLPKNYCDALQEKTDQVERWEEELSKLEPHKRDILQCAAREKFNNYINGCDENVKIMISNIANEDKMNLTIPV